MNRKHKKNYLHEVEQQLIPRLGALGALLLFFSVCSLIYGFFVHPLPLVENGEPGPAIQSEGLILDLVRVGEDDPTTILPEDILNFYFVALLFASIGFFCLFTYWRRIRTLHKFR